jgi:hypothetical protein
VKHPTRYLLGLLVLAVVGLAFGCSNTDRDPIAPAGDSPEALFTAAHPGIENALIVQEMHTGELMKDPEVVGTATGLTDAGEPSVIVLLMSERGRGRVPDRLDGVPVTKIVTGPMKAYKKPTPTPGDDPKSRLTRPIQLGVSGGNANDLANGYCCSGTLGALITKAGKYYILSNSHVLAGDIAASATDPDKAVIGDPIDQPGLIDVQCQKISADFVANLSSLSSLPGNTNVDCAIAEIIPGMVRTDGSILGIGTLSSATLEAYVNLPVKKAGRTTGLTSSKVYAINGNVTVGYEDECNGVAFTVYYTGQIFVTNRANKFLNSGDSGSLLVENVTTNPRAVGLCFAGGGGYAIANPIDDVLSYFGASMVGN